MEIIEDCYEVREHSQGGLQILLKGDYSSKVEQAFEEYDITSILLSKWKGWNSQSLDFLVSFPQLKRIAVFDSEIKDLTVLEKMPNLKELYLECPKAKLPVNLGNISTLKDARIDWRPCFSSILESNSLEALLINEYKESLESFNCKQLTQLDLLKAGKLVNLNGIENLVNLDTLSIFQCSKLESLDSISQLALSKLEVETCKKITDLNVTLLIPTLKELILDKAGSFSSIQVILILTC